jgi:hypothetical protein
MKNAKAVCAIALCSALALAGTANAQCLVQDAAQAALERELELIEALATDPAESFRGPDSCVNMDLLTSFDLSTLIPDLSGLLTSFSFDALNGIIADAQAQVCRQIQDAIDGAIGDATSAVTNFNSGLTDELNGVLTNGWGDLGLNL